MPLPNHRRVALGVNVEHEQEEHEQEQEQEGAFEGTPPCSIRNPKRLNTKRQGPLAASEHLTRRVSDTVT